MLVSFMIQQVSLFPARLYICARGHRANCNSNVTRTGSGLRAHSLFAGSPVGETATAQFSDPVQAEEKQTAFEVEVLIRPKRAGQSTPTKRDKKSFVVQLSITYPKGRVKAVTRTGQYATLLRSVAYNQPKIFANSAM